jgi:transposase-like protein
LLAKFNARKRPVLDKWHVDETYIKVRGKSMYLYRAIDKSGATAEFLFSQTRNLKDAKRFFHKAFDRHGLPTQVTIDGSQTNCEAARASHGAQRMLTRSQAKPLIIRRSRYLNNRIEQDHRRIKRRIRGQDIERAQIYAKRLCAHLWVDSMRRRLQHSKGIHRTVVASPLVAEPAYRQRRDSVVRHLRKYCLGNTFQHEAVSIRDMAKDFG